MRRVVVAQVVAAVAAVGVAAGGIGVAPALPAALGAALGAPGTLGAQEAPRNLTVRVVTAPEGQPLGYSVVAVPARGIERFTSAQGAVVVPVDPGPLLLRVKRLGFTPKDTTILVTDAMTQAVTVALARVTFRLAEVRVVDWPPCTAPGLAEADAQVRGIVDQLRQNAERYRLLVRTYPFIYTMRREFGERSADGSYVAQAVSTLPLESTSDWSYRPGTLVARQQTLAPGRRGEWIMRIPTISDLAEDAFVDAHCFHVAGIEEKEGQRLLRVDMVAADALKSVDVHAAAWLDPEDYQLRHASFTLTRPPPQVRGLLALVTRVRYRELLPFVPVMQLTVAENTVRESRTRTRTYIERQTFERVLFQGVRPDSLLGEVRP